MEDPLYRWKKVRIDQPYARHQHSMVGFREDSPKYSEMKQYLFGGINMPDNMLFNDFWELDFSRAEFDPNTEDQEGCLTKKIQCSGSIPSKRKGHTALCYANNMFVFGGQTQDIDENTTKNIYILDLATYVWTAYDTEMSHISPRSQMSSTWLNPEVVFFFGGLEN
jgi:N-acetylneuraminic acid mutarotase